MLTAGNSKKAQMLPGREKYEATVSKETRVRNNRQQIGLDSTGRYISQKTKHKQCGWHCFLSQPWKATLTT